MKNKHDREDRNSIQRTKIHIQKKKSNQKIRKLKREEETSKTKNKVQKQSRFLSVSTKLIIKQKT